jgi:hypothetical protein
LTPSAEWVIIRSSESRSVEPLPSLFELCKADIIFVTVFLVPQCQYGDGPGAVKWVRPISRLIRPIRSRAARADRHLLLIKTLRSSTETSETSFPSTLTTKLLVSLESPTGRRSKLTSRCPSSPNRVRPSSYFVLPFSLRLTNSFFIDQVSPTSNEKRMEKGNPDETPTTSERRPHRLRQPSQRANRWAWNEAALTSTILESAGLEGRASSASSRARRVTEGRLARASPRTRGKRWRTT